MNSARRLRRIGLDQRLRPSAEDFHRYATVVLRVPSEVHGGHAAGADLPLDGVAVREGGFETVQEVWHTVLSLAATLWNTG